MDDPDLDPRAHRGALRGLARINRLSAADRLLHRAIRTIPANGSLTLLDVATGSGDLPIALWRRARASGLDLHPRACDVSERAVEEARALASRARAPIEFFAADALTDPLAPADVVTCSLFLHHLTEPDAIDLLRRLGRATRRLLLVNDLRRCAPGLALARTVPRVLTSSRVVHVDAVRSAKAAFTMDELRALADEAGLTGARVEPRFPARMLLTWAPAP